MNSFKFELDVPELIQKYIEKLPPKSRFIPLLDVTCAAQYDVKDRAKMLAYREKIRLSDRETRIPLIENLTNQTLRYHFDKTVPSNEAIAEPIKTALLIDKILQLGLEHINRIQVVGGEPWSNIAFGTSTQTPTLQDQGLIAEVIRINLESVGCYKEFKGNVATYSALLDDDTGSDNYGRLREGRGRRARRRVLPPMARPRRAKRLRGALVLSRPVGYADTRNE